MIKLEIEFENKFGIKHVYLFSTYEKVFCVLYEMGIDRDNWSSFGEAIMLTEKNLKTEVVLRKDTQIADKKCNIRLSIFPVDIIESDWILNQIKNA